MVIPIRPKYESVASLAKNMHFDIHRVPAKYYVICDWSNELVKMFDDSPMGDEEAINWMKEKRGITNV